MSRLKLLASDVVSGLVAICANPRRVVVLLLIVSSLRGILAILVAVAVLVLLGDRASAPALLLPAGWRA